MTAAAWGGAEMNGSHGQEPADRTPGSVLQTQGREKGSTGKMELLPQDSSATLWGTSPTPPFFLGAGRAFSSPSLTWCPGEEGPLHPGPPEAQHRPHPLSSAQQLLPGAGSLGGGCVQGTHSRLCHQYRDLFLPHQSTLDLSPGAGY